MLRILCSILFLVGLSLQATPSVHFSFQSESISDSKLKEKMEKDISVLLTEITQAGNENRELNLGAVNMEATAKEHLISLWRMLPFVCADQTVSSRCLNDFQGYQVRGIRIIMRPKDNSYSQSLIRELTISINKTGVITGVRPALEMQEDVRKILSESSDVEDITRRREILKWVEDFRCYYNEKNINSLRQIFSDDALIITGSVVTQKQSTDYGSQLKKNVKYSIQGKQEYLEKLSKVFLNNQYLNIKFSNISVVKHGAKPNIYGVTLHQSWTSSNYSDEGWLFLLWDFNDPGRPQIHVRTWQADEIVNDNGVFGLDDFFIP